MLRGASNTRQKRLRFAAVMLVAVLVAACSTQKHTVKPLPDFVSIAIEPGDEVEIITHEGKMYGFEVTGVTEKAIFGDDRRVPLADIADLKRLGGKRPPSPCGGTKELGCSVPLLVSLASKEHKHYRDEFYDACAQHDYCYRHGSATYGVDRQHCDEEFYQNMKNTCPEQRSSTIATIFEALGNDIESSLTCLRIATDFYNAAKDFGDKHFRTTHSTYCEYDGPSGALLRIQTTR